MRSATFVGQAVLAVAAAAGPALAALPKDEGYRGIWYANQPSGDQYAYKYSGGMATYPQQHIPIARYAPAVEKTFFCYGGTAPERREVWEMVAYYDHRRGVVPRPTILLNKQTGDAHENPTLAIDNQGHVWIFSNAHGNRRPAFVHRSLKPYDIDDFELVEQTNFSYSQPWYLDGAGFVFLHTRYSPGRNLFVRTSRDGRTWDEPRPLARFGQGHYQVSTCQAGRVITAFNYHPQVGGLNARTNLYYLESHDAGQTWTTAAGAPVATPLVEIDNAALVRDYQAEGLLVYLKDVALDEQLQPVVLFLTSRGYASGPANDPRTWYTARWDGAAWQIRPVTASDHNYDFGSLYLEPGGAWRIIAPTLAGPQAYNPGGQVALWQSDDQGASWRMLKQLTHDSHFNHSYVRRPVDAHPQFYALWADGDARRPSPSSLYFTDRDGSQVWRLPRQIDGDEAEPEIVW